MNRIYPRFEIVSFGKHRIKFKLSFISTRLAKLILKKTLAGEWDIPQIPTIPLANTFMISGFVPVFASPSGRSCLFIKESPGLYNGRLYFK